MAKKSKDSDSNEPAYDPRDEQLAILFKQAEKNYGKGVVGFAKAHRYKDIKRVRTGVLGLDIALGGGLPIGRISNFFGPKSSSKTTSFIVTPLQRSCGLPSQCARSHERSPVPRSSARPSP